MCVSRVPRLNACLISGNEIGGEDSSVTDGDYNAGLAFHVIRFLEVRCTMQNCI